MSSELRVKENGRIECGWGVIEIGNQRFKREDMMPLLLIDVTRVQHLLADGPQAFTCWWDGKQIPATNDGKRDGDRLFYHAHFNDDHFVYELHEAHWAGKQGLAGYVGGRTDGPQCSGRPCSPRGRPDSCVDDSLRTVTTSAMSESLTDR